MGIKSQLREIYESTLEGVSRVLSRNFSDSRGNFEPRKEITFLKSKMKFVERPHSEIVRMLLEELSHSFDASLLFCSKDGEDHLIGKCIYGKSEEAEDFVTRLPNIPLDKIQKTNAKKLNGKWNLYLPEFSSEALVLLYRPCENYKFLFFSELPEIILRDIADQAHDVLMNSFTET